MAFGARGKFKGKGKGPRRENKQNALFKRKRFCRFTVENVDQIDYKDVDTLRDFIGENGKILAGGQSLIAYALKKCEYPLGPLVLALVLGPLMEKSFRQTLIGAQGDVLEFVSRPISGALLAAAAVLLVLPVIRRALGGSPMPKIAD